MLRPALHLVLGFATLALLSACASPPTSAPPELRASGSVRPGPNPVHAPTPSRHAVRTALAMLGAPYRYGGSTPAGFDCSGLVVYSYAQAGVSGLPRTAAALEDASRPIDLEELEPGDLLFFQLRGRKTTHVGLYVGDRSFVHAPSSGGRVERVRFDHVYWGPRLHRAGRLLRH